MRIAFIGLIFLFILTAILFFGRNGVVDVINKKAILKEYINRQDMILSDIENYEMQIASIHNNTALTEDLIKSRLYLTSKRETLYIDRNLNQERYGIYLTISQTGTSASTKTNDNPANASEIGSLGDSQ